MRRFIRCSSDNISLRHNSKTTYNCESELQVVFVTIIIFRFFDGI